MPDFNFVGPSYEAANPLQDNQRLINWFPEIDQNDGAKAVMSLLGCPGLSAVASTQFGQARGGWVLPGNTKALVVAGNMLYLLTVTTPATATAKAQFSVASVGSLVTYTGPVCMRDNGAGGIVVIVDGPNGYVYNIAGNTLTKITDAAFYGADRVAFIDGWLVFNKPGTQIFYTSPLYWNGTDPFNATYYALKDSSSDNLVTNYENNRELWLIGERSTEIWYDAGGQNFPFSRLQGATLQVGCSAKHSICRLGMNAQFGGGSLFGSSLVWLARNEFGENAVVMSKGYQVGEISTPAVAYAISQYSVIDDAIGFSYIEEGHMFYMLTFPTADVTWCYDTQSGMWHQRASFDPLTGQFHRHRSNFLINFANQRIVGDYQNGTLYQMSRTAYSDESSPLVCVRRAPHVWDDRKRIALGRLQVEFTPGVGLQTGQGSDPQAMLRVSKDGGQTFGNEKWSSVGKAGKTKNRCIWRRLGMSRDTVFEVRFSDPVKRDVVGATLLAGGTGA